MDIRKIFENYGLQAHEMESVCNSFMLHKYEHDDVVFHEHDEADRFYFVKSGQALVTKKTPKGTEEHINVLKEGQCFGEIGLLENIKRTASVKAMGELEIFEIEKAAFTALMESSPPFATLIKNIGVKRMLRQVTIFNSLDEHSLSEIQRIIVEENYKKGNLIFKEGASADALYIILTGSVRVFSTAASGKQINLAFMGQGEVFGVQGVIESDTRSASVDVQEDCKLLVMKRDAFHQLLQTNAKISFNIMKILSQRVRENNREIMQSKGVSYFRGMTIVTRPDRCMACKSCEIACAVAKSKSQGLYSALNETPLPVKRIRVRKVQDGSEPVVRPEHCTHCKDAPCLSSCKFGAMKRDALSGTVDIIVEKCVGCGLCAKACHFNVISLVRNQGKRRVALKCTYCSEHQEGPACVRSCPTNALVIGLAPKTEI